MADSERQILKMTAGDWRVMAALMVGIALSPLNVMFTSVALPTMRTEFAVTVEQATWIGTAYFIPSVALMPFQTQLGQRWGTRRIYALGLLILSAGAFLTALAPNFGWLLAARAVQGIGWSALYPLALILIRQKFPSGRQGEMVGLWESSVGLMTIISPVIAGFLVEYLGWQALFVVTGVVAVGGALLTLVAIPPGEQRSSSAPLDVGWTSVLGLTLALILTLLAVARRNPPLLIVSLLIWLAWGWLARGSTISAVLVNRRFMTASLAANIRMLVAIAALTALPLFFEDVQGLSPSLVGSLLLIYSIFLFLGSWPGGRWSDSAGPAVPGIVGYVAMIAGTLLLLGLDAVLSVVLVAVALIFRGLGAGLSQAPYAKAATGAVQPGQTRLAAGLYGTVRYSGLALGTALVGMFLQARLTHYDALAGGPAAVPAYHELWLVLTGFLVVGLALTLLMARSRPAPLSASGR